MATYLLTWNAARTSWRTISEDARYLRKNGHASRSFRWSCGRRRTLEINSEVFLLRQGKDNPGLVAHGRIIKAPFEDDHWDAERAGDTAWYIRFRPDYIVDSESEEALNIAQSSDPIVRKFPWRTRVSGIEIKEPALTKVRALWDEFTLASLAMASETAAEPLQDKRYPEGAKLRIVVNRYERDSLARKRCLDHHGRSCRVCGMTFHAQYGDQFAKIIEVHHVTPISQLGTGYEVDPINDLCPVCPNCHAALHVENPPLKPEQLAAMLRGNNTVTASGGTAALDATTN